MTLATRVFGTAQLRAGRPWAIRIGARWGGASIMMYERNGDGPAPAAPSWADIDRHLSRSGYARRDPAPSTAPEDGLEFDVVGWDRTYQSRRFREERERETVALPDMVAVPLPPGEVAGIRQALDAWQALRPWWPDAIAALRTGLDEAGPVTVMLSADAASSLQSALEGIDGWSGQIGENSLRVLRDLRDHLDRGHSAPDTWPLVRDTLRTALREALSRPGAEGLAARDELLDVIGRFADAHRTATAADDAVQQRLQTERAEPEQRTPPPGPAR
jgi:hypothetical protein